MRTIFNRVMISLGTAGALGMTVALLTQLRQPPQETLSLYAHGLTLFAAFTSLLASFFALFSIDKTGITEEGRVTSIIPVLLAACGMALTLRWAPDRVPWAIAWLVLHLPGIWVGAKTPKSNLQQTLRRQQSIEDRQIAVQWELKQLTNRVKLLEQLLGSERPDPQAQRKLSFTGNTVEKYYADTRQQVEDFLQQTEDDTQRATAAQLLTSLQRMHVSDP